MNLLLPFCVNLVPYTDPEKLRRQEIAAQSIDSIRENFLLPINACLSDEVIEREGWITSSALQWVTSPGTVPKKLPLVRDLFDQASAVAEIHGCEWFAVANADIILTNEWKSRVKKLLQGEEEIFIFARTDLDRDSEGTLNQNPKLFHRGQDLYLCRVKTWEKIRHHFHSYILGEAYWDNIFTALFLTYAKGYLVLDQLGLCLHERHSKSWGESQLHRHNLFLANGPDIISTLRWKYFHLGLLLRAEDAGRSLDEQELRKLIQDMFVEPMPEELDFSKKMQLRFEKMGLKELE